MARENFLNRWRSPKVPPYEKQVDDHQCADTSPATHRPNGLSTTRVCSATNAPSAEPNIARLGANQPSTLEIEEQRISKFSKFIKKSPFKNGSWPTRKIYKVVAIAVIAALFALFAIYYLATLVHHQSRAETIVYQTEEKEIRVNIEEVDQINKVFKDIRGKAKHKTNKHGTKESSLPDGPVKVSSDKPASATQISETLDLVRQNVAEDRKQLQNKELRLWQSADQPLRVLLVSTWQSGADYVSRLLQSHSGVFQHYEPLSYIGLKQVRSRKESFQAQQLIHRLLDCNYVGLTDYMNFTRLNVHESIGPNARVWQACAAGPNPMACADRSFLSMTCRMFPIQLVKTTRLPLNITQLLLNDQKLRVKVLFMVRDPRGTLAARFHDTADCDTSMDCSSPDALCSDIRGDLKTATAFQKLYPERFLKLRYEDFKQNGKQEIKRLLSFLGLELTEGVQSYWQKTFLQPEAPWASIQSEGSTQEGVPDWKEQLSQRQIKDIMVACEDVLATLKYNN